MPSEWKILATDEYVDSELISSRNVFSTANNGLVPKPGFNQNTENHVLCGRGSWIQLGQTASGDSALTTFIANVDTPATYANADIGTLPVVNKIDTQIAITSIVGDGTYVTAHSNDAHELNAGDTVTLSNVYDASTGNLHAAYNGAKTVYDTTHDKVFRFAETNTDAVDSLNKGQFLDGVDDTFQMEFQATSPSDGDVLAWDTSFGNSGQWVSQDIAGEKATATITGILDDSTIPAIFDTELITLIDQAGTSKTYKFMNGGGKVNGDLDGGSVVIQLAGETTKEGLVDNIEQAIESANGHNGSILVSRTDAVLTLTQNVIGSAGNTAITFSDDISTTTGLNKSNFSGGRNTITTGGGGGGSSVFTGLTDTPGSIASLQFIRGNSGGTALEHVSTIPRNAIATGTADNIVINSGSGGLTSVAQGTAFNKDFGTSSGNVSEGDHTHTNLASTTGTFEVGAGSTNSLILSGRASGGDYTVTLAVEADVNSSSSQILLPVDSGSAIVLASTATAQTLTNKTIDADNNTISNIEVDNLKSGVLDTDITTVSASDDTVASAKAIKTYVDADTGTSSLTYTVGEGASTNKLKLNAAIGGGDYTLSIIPDGTIASNQTVTIPAAADTLANLNSVQTFTNKTTILKHDHSTAGNSMGEIVKFGTGTTVAGYIYYLTDAGAWAFARNDAISTSGNVLLGMALGTSPSSDGMLLRGTIKYGESLGTHDIGIMYYVSDTNGKITSTVPSGTGDIIRVVAYSIEEDGENIFFNPANTFLEV